MKAYNLGSSAKVQVSDYQVEAIELGEQGRARTRQIIPCPLGLKDGDEVAVGSTRSGGVKLMKRIMSTTERINMDLASSHEGWVARVSCEGAYVKGGSGYLSFLPDRGQVKLLSKGRGAHGAAGGCGSWDDLLVQVPVGAVLRVKPMRWDPYYLVFTKEKVVKVKGDEVSVMMDMLDMDIPTDRDAYTRL